MNEPIEYIYNNEYEKVLWMLGVANKKLPLYKSFDIILYALSTAFVLWVVIKKRMKRKQIFTV